jgi:hypothetical protein
MDKKEGEGNKVIIKFFVYSSLFFCYSVSDRDLPSIWIRRNSIIRTRCVHKLLQNARILDTENYHGFILMVDKEVFTKLYQLMDLDLRKKADRRKADILANPQEKLPVEATAGMV